MAPKEAFSTAKVRLTLPDASTATHVGEFAEGDVVNIEYVRAPQLIVPF